MGAADLVATVIVGQKFGYALLWAVIVGCILKIAFVYGAAAMAGTGIPLNALFPGPSVAWWGIISGLIGAGLVLVNRYAVFEKICAALVGVMFVVMVLAAAFTVPNLGELAAGLLPSIPEGGLVNLLSVAGGVGGTITLAAYGYWIREKGWNTDGHMRLMRVDNTVAYVVTGIFVIATLIVGRSCCTRPTRPSPVVRRACCSSPTCWPSATDASWAPCS
ncbi:Nramp family divalent metal transporter [Kytococcus sedentarius]|uniref:Nramp family divalent metal transporter n=1 Tax=Kytococcus sedentarius TaxID=1276 RepID=UPI003879E778